MAASTVERRADTPQLADPLEKPAAGTLSIDNVAKSFQTAGGSQLDVIRGLSLELDAGEFVSIIGPSGCGKSTLLYLISGLQLPTAGRILIDGKPIAGPGRDRGLVFQQDVLLGWRTVLRNVEYGLELRGVPKAEREEIARRYIKLVGLDKYERLLPKELSGGMKKRAQIAAVFANNPRILLMDEPFGALDYPTKIELQRELQKMWIREQKLVVFVTHDLEEALYMSTKIVALRGGETARVYEVPFAFPRTDELRVDPEFQRSKRELWEFIEG